MPWSTSRRHDTLPIDWHKIRARTWRNAGGRCEWTEDGQRCTWTSRLNGDGGQCDHTNGPAGPTTQWLCPTHHLAKSSDEGHQAMREVRAAALHPHEPHPALHRT